jgi:23S rRNA (adenine-N6)-dimethyltransferase
VAAGGRRDGPARWGYHRLVDRWARRLVAGAGVEAGDLVLDVGAGAGALTAPLVAAGARVVAIELHARRADALRRRFAGAPVTVVRADAAELRLPRRPFRVVANPPFAITTGLLRRLLSPGSRLVTADLVVPRHVARRWTGGGAPGARRWATAFVARTSGALPPDAFRPRAPAHPIVLRLERRA